MDETDAMSQKDSLIPNTQVQIVYPVYRYRNIHCIDHPSLALVYTIVRDIHYAHTYRFLCKNTELKGSVSHLSANKNDIRIVFAVA
jgi:hypothetical protein